jgi:hypothetical protein
MTNARILLALLPLAFGTHAVSAETVTLTCEYWHKRLGQLEDKTITINFDAQTCNAQPCKITDTELKWQQEGGLMEITINRASGEGSQFVSSQEAALYKNCRATKSKA